jgi:hypothetical protein
MSGDNKAFTLALLRLVLVRVKEIESELKAIGIAAKGDLIDPAEAIKQFEMIVPGCLAVAYESLFTKSQEKAA